MALWIAALGAIVVGTLCAGYFSGFETGLYTLSRIRLRHRRDEGDRGAVVLQGILARPRRAIATTLVGHNLCVYVVTAITTKVFEGVWPHWAELASTVTLALPLFLFAEVIPKEVARRAADRLPYLLAPSFRAVQRALWPAVTALVLVVRLWERMLGQRAGQDEWSDARRLGYYLAVGQRSGLLSAEQTRMADNILRIGRRTVADVMVPMALAEAVPDDADEEEVIGLIGRSEHRRLLVYHRRLDRVVGVVTGLELLLSRAVPWPDRLSRAMRPVQRIRARMTVLEALERMRREELSVAVVEDGRGVVVGMVTLGDLVEEIVGELERPGCGDERPENGASPGR